MDGGIRHRNRREQRFGIRMQWIAEQRARRCDLYDPAEIHHRDPVADMLDHGEIVCTKRYANEFSLQIDEQVDDLRLHRNIERRDWLIADDQFRPGCQGARDAEGFLCPPENS